jgi:hypothetical protein
MAGLFLKNKKLRFLCDYLIKENKFSIADDLFDLIKEAEEHEEESEEEKVDEEESEERYNIESEYDLKTSKEFATYDPATFFGSKLDDKYPELAMLGLNSLYTGSHFALFFKLNLDDKYPNSVEPFIRRLDVGQYLDLGLDKKHLDSHHIFSANIDDLSVEQATRSGYYKMYFDEYIEKIMTADFYDLLTSLSGLDLTFIMEHKDKFEPVFLKLLREPSDKAYFVSKLGLHKIYTEHYSEIFKYLFVSPDNVNYRNRIKLYLDKEYWRYDTDRERVRDTLAEIAQHAPDLTLQYDFLPEEYEEIQVSSLDNLLALLETQKTSGPPWEEGSIDAYSELPDILSRLFGSNFSAKDSRVQLYFEKHKDILYKIFMNLFNFISGEYEYSVHRASESIFEFILDHELDSIYDQTIKTMLKERVGQAQKLFSFYRNQKYIPDYFLFIENSDSFEGSLMKEEYSKILMERYPDLYKKYLFLFLENDQGTFLEVFSDIYPEYNEEVADGLLEQVKHFDLDSILSGLISFFLKKDQEDKAFADRFPDVGIKIAQQIIKADPKKFFSLKLDERYPQIISSDTDIKVEDLSFSRKGTINRLSLSGIKFLSQIIHIDDSDLLKLPGIGRSSLRDIRETISELDPDSLPMMNPVRRLILKNPVLYFYPFKDYIYTKPGEANRTRPGAISLKERYPEYLEEAALTLASRGSSFIHFMEESSISDDLKLSLIKKEDVKKAAYRALFNAPFDFIEKDIWKLFPQETRLWLDSTINDPTTSYRITRLVGLFFNLDRRTLGRGEKTLSREQDLELKEVFPDIARKLVSILVKPEHMLATTRSNLFVRIEPYWAEYSDIVVPALEEMLAGTPAQINMLYRILNEKVRSNSPYIIGTPIEAFFYKLLVKYSEANADQVVMWLSLNKNKINQKFYLDTVDSVSRNYIKSKPADFIKLLIISSEEDPHSVPRHLGSFLKVVYDDFFKSLSEADKNTIIINTLGQVSAKALLSPQTKVGPTLNFVRKIPGSEEILRGFVDQFIDQFPKELMWYYQDERKKDPSAKYDVLSKEDIYLMSENLADIDPEFFIDIYKGAYKGLLGRPFVESFDESNSEAPIIEGFTDIFPDAIIDDRWADKLLLHKAIMSLADKNPLRLIRYFKSSETSQEDSISISRLNKTLSRIQVDPIDPIDPQVFSSWAEMIDWQGFYKETLLNAAYSIGFESKSWRSTRHADARRQTDARARAIVGYFNTSKIHLSHPELTAKVIDGIIASNSKAINLVLELQANGELDDHIDRIISFFSNSNFRDSVDPSSFFASSIASHLSEERKEEIIMSLLVDGKSGFRRDTITLLSQIKNTYPDIVNKILRMGLDASIVEVANINEDIAIEILNKEAGSLSTRFLHHFKSSLTPAKFSNMTEKMQVAHSDLLRRLIKEGRLSQDATWIWVGFLARAGFEENLMKFDDFLIMFPEIKDHITIRATADSMRKIKELEVAKVYFEKLDSENPLSEGSITTDPNIKISKSIYQASQRPNSFNETRFTLSQNNVDPTDLIYKIGKSLIHAGDGVAHSNVGISGFTSSWAKISTEDDKFVIEQYQSDYPVFLFSVFNVEKRTVEDFEDMAFDHGSSAEELMEKFTQTNNHLKANFTESEYLDARRHFDYISKAYPYFIIANCLRVAKQLNLQYIYILKNAPNLASIKNKDKARKLYVEIPQLAATEREVRISGEPCWQIPVSDENISLYERESKRSVFGSIHSIYDFSLTPNQNKRSRTERRKKDMSWSPTPEKTEKLKDIIMQIKSKFTDVDVPELYSPDEAIKFLNTKIRGKIVPKKRFGREVGPIIGELAILKRSWDRSDRLIKLSGLLAATSTKRKDKLFFTRSLTRG